MLVACSGSSRSIESFCGRLTDFTGPAGAEVAFSAGDPARLDAIIVELTELHDRAPDDIATSTATVLNIFEQYARVPRDARRDVLSANEARLIEASQELDAYALSECGVFLQRTVPTAIPTADPGVEIAPE